MSKVFTAWYKLSSHTTSFQLEPITTNSKLIDNVNTNEKEEIHMVKNPDDNNLIQTPIILGCLKLNFLWERLYLKNARSVIKTLKVGNIKIKYNDIMKKCKEEFHKLKQNEIIECISKSFTRIMKEVIYKIKRNIQIRIKLGKASIMLADILKMRIQGYLAKLVVDTKVKHVNINEFVDYLAIM